MSGKAGEGRSRSAAAGRRGQLEALVIGYAYRAIWALLTVAPATLAAGEILGRHPSGDAAFWERGGLWASETVRLIAPRSGTIVAEGGAVALLGALGWLLPLGVMMATFGQPTKALRDRLAVAARGLPTMSLLLGTFTLVKTLVFGGLTLLAIMLVRGASSVSGQQWPLGLVALGLLGAWSVAVLHDLARWSCLLEGHGFWGSLSRAFSRARRERRLWWSAAWRTLAAIALLSFCAWMTSIYVAGSVSFATATQQLAIAGFVALRASWFACIARSATES